MIKWRDAIREARLLIGTPYAQLDCINLIKKVIRSAPGGVPGYTTAGTNALWDSFNASTKYRDLTWRQEGIAGARAGMLAFKRYGADDEGHVGIVTDDGTVIHASSEYGSTVETKLSETDGWDLLAVHRFIQPKSEEEKDMSEEILFKAKVDTVSGPLNLRELPAKTAMIIEKMPKGAIVGGRKDRLGVVARALQGGDRLCGGGVHEPHHGCAGDSAAGRGRPDGAGGHYRRGGQCVPPGWRSHGGRGDDAGRRAAGGSGKH